MLDFLVMAEQLKPQQLNHREASGWSRRDFLRGAGAVAASTALLPLEAACTLFPAKKEAVFRKEEGPWSQAEVEKAARAMMEDRRFATITHAGELLLRNQRGEKAISSEAPIFSDNRIGIKTVTNIPSPYAGYTGEFFSNSAYIATDIAQEGPSILVTLKPKREGEVPQQTIEGGSRFTIEEFLVNKSRIEGKSDIAFKFLLAKEIYNAHAFQIVASRNLQELSEYYEIPNNESIRRAIQTSIIDVKTAEGVRATIIADILAHFYVIPDYKKALDLGLLTEEDKKTLNFIDLAANVMEDAKFLVKDRQGNYRWAEQGARLENLWVIVAYSVHKVFFEK